MTDNYNRYNIIKSTKKGKELKMYNTLGKCHSKLTRNKVWCTVCGKTQEVDSTKCFQFGWPECCGYTMTIDSPEERGEEVKGESDNGFNLSHFTLDGKEQFYIEECWGSKPFRNGINLTLTIEQAKMMRDVLDAALKGRR